jgi:hypothetical protein
VFVNDNVVEAMVDATSQARIEWGIGKGKTADSWYVNINLAWYNDFRKEFSLRQALLEEIAFVEPQQGIELAELLEEVAAEIRARFEADGDTPVGAD